jgi:mRNA interferase MazF
MKLGTIALARVQQADGRLKTRPVLLLSLMPPFSDYLVCALSSKLHHECPDFDEVIAVDDDDFGSSGLKVASLVRLGMVATIPGSVLLGELGVLSETRLQRLCSRLARHLGEQQ